MVIASGAATAAATGGAGRRARAAMTPASTTAMSARPIITQRRVEATSDRSGTPDAASAYADDSESSILATSSARASTRLRSAATGGSSVAMSRVAGGSTVIVNGAGPNSKMVGFKGKMPEQDVWHILNYLRSLGPKTPGH